MRKRPMIMALLFLVCCSCGSMQSGHVLYENIDISAIVIDETDADYVFLRDEVENFAYMGWGEIGHIREGLDAFRAIFEKENALDYFYRLETDAKYEGKLYALCGLYFLDHMNYPYLMEKYGSMVDVEVNFAEAGVMRIPISEIIRREDSEYPVVRLQGAEDTLNAWFERNPTVNSHEVDFYGGGIPYIVRYE